MKTVLIVDDCQNIRDLVSGLLKSHFDVEVLIASSGNEAIQIIPYKNIDLVFSDFNMEGGTGLDIFNYIKKENLSIPFVLSSALELSHILKVDDAFSESISNNETLFLIKPFSVKQLCEKVESILKIEKEVDFKNYISILPSLLSLCNKNNIKTFLQNEDGCFSPLADEITNHFEKALNRINEKKEKIFIKIDDFDCIQKYLQKSISSFVLNLLNENLTAGRS